MTEAILINGSAETVSETWTDKHGNILEVRVDGVIQITNTYNSDDTPNSTTDEITGSETIYEYDPVTKRVVSSEKSSGTDVAAITEKYGYNEYGQLSGRSVTGEVDHTYSYAYKDNAERELDYIILPNSLRSKTESDVNNRLTEQLITDANGDKLFGTYFYYRKYGNRGTEMVSSLRYGGVRNGKYVIGGDLKYKYDKAGNIAEIFENGISLARYTYDSLSRLIQEDNRNVNETFIFAYDNNGNILSKMEAIYTVKPTDEIVEFENIFHYDYDGIQRDRLTGINGESISYDQIGNPLSYFGKTLTWQKGRQLAGIDNITFSYDGLGKRIRKNNTVFTYSPDGKLVRQSDNSDTLEFIYDGNGLVGFNRNGTDYIYRKNISGDITHILDINGNVLVRYDYDAWGRHAITDDSGVNLAQINPFRYRGYYYDVETGLYYCKARYYDPTVCRFINADEISEIDLETIGGLNLYVYCGNNPVVRIDPTGCGWFSNLVTAVAVVAVAAVVITSIVLTAGAAVAAVATAYVSSSTAVAIGTAVTVGAYGVAAGIGICAASDVGEIYTGTNVVRDYAMGGNQELYDFT